MIKTVIKEIGFILLLCTAIGFLLGVIFYDYNPINKVVPNKIAYSAPENIRNELEESVQSSTPSVENKVYTIEGSDLNIYKRSNTYNPSKENPFASTPSVDSDIDGSNVNANIQNNNSTNNNNTSSTNTNTSSKQNTGLK